MLRFSKVLVANRGEIASRIIRTTKNMGIKSIALCNDIDKNSSYIKEADEAVFVSGAKNVFLDIDTIIRIAKKYHADAIHPGYGFLSENPEFSKRCNESGIKFVGPSYSTMQLLSSKKDAKELARQCGIPVVPGYSGPDQSTVRLIEEIERIGYPVLVKASMGGGGRGMRILPNSSNIEEVISSCRNEAQRHFGDSCLLVEKYLPRTHHLEIQVFGDAQGNVIHFGERECSLQRRYQKIIEESPCFYLTDEERSKLYTWALQLAQKSHYEGAATVEFLCDAATRQLYFMEVNTRLQVEHLVTQCVNHQIDLVELQLRIAQGESLKDIGVTPYRIDAAESISLPSIYKKGPNCGKYAMECRVFNEDPENHYLPGEGLARFSNFVNDDHTVIENNVPSSASAVSFDPMLLKVITTGETREEVLHRMENALRRCSILGVPTNIQMLVNALHLEKFQKEGADSQTVDEYSNELTGRRELTDFEIGYSLANYLYSQLLSSHSHNPWSCLTSFSNSVPLTRLGSITINGSQFDYRYESNQVAIRRPGQQWREPIAIEWLGEEGEEIRVRVMDEIVRSVVRKENESVHLFPVSNTDHFSSVHYDVFESISQPLPSDKTSAQSASVSTVVSPMPGSVSRVLVKNGEKVKKGDIVVVIEAMKMEHLITAPSDGVVSMGELTERQFLKKGQSIFRVLSPIS